MVNGGAIGLLLKFGLLFFGILGLVFVIAILTPHIARVVKSNAKSKNTGEKIDESEYKVKGIYDARAADDKENLNNKDENDG
ncbi:MAG: hypothetical protein GX365_05190 [Clostridiales bacterium]|nr:hypothetical protein [Clostridiales bacterium]